MYLETVGMIRSRESNAENIERIAISLEKLVEIKLEELKLLKARNEKEENGGSHE